MLENVGLGLSEVTRFAQISRGQVEIESEEGNGTMVSLQLPLLEIPLSSLIGSFPQTIPIRAGTTPTALTPHNTPLSAAERVKFHVLIAEDNPTITKIMSISLKNMGHQVTTTANGQECFNMFTANPCVFDLIFMDLQVSLCHQHTNKKPFQGVHN